VATSTVQADRARPRGGGSGGGGGRGSGGSGHRGQPHAGSVPRSSPTQAQLRHPRAGTGTGYRYGYYGHHGYGHHGHYGYPYYPYYGYGYPYYGYPYFGFGLSFAWGSPYYGYGYPDGYGYAAAPAAYYGDRYNGGGAASMRVQVDPEQTKVYVDGYYAGVVDDYDGIFQRLNMSPGRHEIMLKLDGYRTYRVRVYASPDQTIDLQHEMQRGGGEEQGADLGDPSVEYARDDRERGRDRELTYDAPREASRETATLRLDVVPPDATVYVDGEFHGVARELRSLRLPAGRHEVEVVRPGYLTQSRVVDLRAGEDTDLGIDLPRP
jgi:hypothetical protein